MCGKIEKGEKRKKLGVDAEVEVLEVDRRKSEEKRK